MATFLELLRRKRKDRLFTLASAAVLFAAASGCEDPALKSREPYDQRNSPERRMAKLDGEAESTAVSYAMTLGDIDPIYPETAAQMADGTLAFVGELRRKGVTDLTCRETLEAAAARDRVNWKNFGEVVQTLRLARLPDENPTYRLPELPNLPDPPEGVDNISEEGRREVARLLEAQGVHILRNDQWGPQGVTAFLPGATLKNTTPEQRDELARRISAHLGARRSAYLLTCEHLFPQE